MILCIDSGNSRIKWGLAEGSGWRAQAALPQGEAAQLRAVLEQWQPLRAVYCNVAGASAGSALQDVLAAIPAEELHTQAAGNGVINGYAQPHTLGVDRWHALIGARALHAGACLAVMAGTATTIDSLDEAGCFTGGFILPGVELMRRALARDTAALPLAAGAWSARPQCTVDAIASGCLEAQAGAIERAFARLPDGALCLLSGGGAEALAPLLRLPCRRVDNLVLEGLRERATNGS